MSTKRSALLDRFAKLHGLNTDTEIADYLGVHKQSVYRYRNSESEDIGTKLLEKEMNSRNKRKKR